MAGKSGRPKGSHDIASQIRGAFLRAAAMSEEDGRPLSIILLDLLQSDPKACLDTVAKFVPREMLIEATVVEQLDSLSDEALELEVGRLIAESAALSAVARKAEQVKH